VIITNKYERWYWALMNRALSRHDISERVEKHHVFPQCVYGKNSFVVKLTRREHYVAHLLLAKFLGKQHPKLWLAITRMNKPSVYNSRLYSLARQKTSEWRSLKNRTELDYSRVLPRIHRNNSLLQNRPWKNFNVKKDNLIFWKKADVVYDLYINKKYPDKQMHSYICGKIDLPVSKLKILRNMIRLIDSGWVPSQDEEWLQLTQSS